MGKGRFISNMAVAGAALMFLSMHFFVKNMASASFIPLVFAAMVLVAADIMMLATNLVSTVVWASIFAIATMVWLNPPISIGLYLLLVSGVLISVILGKISESVKDQTLALALLLNVWGMFPYIFFSDFGGVWRLFVGLGLGLIATIPYVVIKLVLWRAVKPKIVEEKKALVE